MLIGQTAAQLPCRPPGEPLVANYGYGKTFKVVFYRPCNKAEMQAYWEHMALAVRERLGDPGRH
jgi:hypothetical protein